MVAFGDELRQLLVYRDFLVAPDRVSAMKQSRGARGTTPVSQSVSYMSDNASVLTQSSDSAESLSGLFSADLAFFLENVTHAVGALDAVLARGASVPSEIVVALGSDGERVEDAWRASVSRALPDLPTFCQRLLSYCLSIGDRDAELVRLSKKHAFQSRMERVRERRRRAACALR